MATAAAPTYFWPHRDGGYTFVDGGIWANNPTMIGVTEALTLFNLPRERVHVLSLGCGDDPYRVSGSKILKGGAIHWHDIIYAAMRLQSQRALGQAGLLVGRENLLRIDVPTGARKIALDDWLSASTVLRPLAEAAVELNGERIKKEFLDV